MATADYHAHPYVRQLNEWHLELAMLRDLVDHILTEIEGPDWMTSSAHIAQDRFAHLVETCPFPKEDHIHVEQHAAP
mgnify:FL=1